MMETLISLITDEYAEIRLAASKLIKKGEGKLTFNDNKALVVIFEEIFKTVKEYLDKSGAKENELSLVKKFVFSNLSDPAFENYKYLALYNSRIFNYDKPNKYREDVKVVNCMIIGIKNSGIQIKFSKEEYEKFIEENEVKLAHNFEKELKIYFSDVFTRNEFIFGKGLQKMAFEILSGEEDFAIAKNYFKQFLIVND